MFLHSSSSCEFLVAAQILLYPVTSIVNFILKSYGTFMKTTGGFETPSTTSLLIWCSIQT